MVQTAEKGRVQWPNILRIFRLQNGFRHVSTAYKKWVGCLSMVSENVLRKVQNVYMRVLFPTRSWDFLIKLILPAALRSWGWLSLLEEGVPGILLRCKERPARKANLTAIFEPII
jgi:hypothetical protein